MKPAPKGWLNGIRHLGPGLIISAMIVGSGELIVTPKLGASVGFSLLWFIVLGCLLKVFVQVELGRFAVSEGVTTLEAMNLIPGPRFIVSWLLWVWLLMYIGLVFQVAGMLGGLGSVVQLAGLPLNRWVAILLIAALCLIPLLLGRYRAVEGISTLLVALFTGCTLAAVGALQWTPYAIDASMIVEGLRFQLPDSFTTAFAAFGVIGVGASELIYYPYWCLEKGYARNVGPRDGSASWTERARGWIRIMRMDAWVSFCIYTVATLAFYLLGAAVLHAQGHEVENAKMIETLASMFLSTLGRWSHWLFLAGAFTVLFSTVFGATASNARLFADAASLFKVVRYRDGSDRQWMIAVACVVLMSGSTMVCLLWEAPVSLVFIGAVGQGLMLPFLAIAALYFRFRKVHASLRPGIAWSVALVTSALAISAVGIYQVGGLIKQLLSASGGS